MHKKKYEYKTWVHCCAQQPAEVQRLKLHTENRLSFAFYSWGMKYEADLSAVNIVGILLQRKAET